ncbi:hypothetical protein A9971_00425 [Pseudomonas sp. UME65]|uniref:hypothetical protein n=1 Tax=Pseudomonas TaxID=286 RepID=UPI001600BDF9|nr:MULTISPECIES: hypothetical protein [Pseudomonas]MBB1617345.1 hypothetical protein [Pseudomonas sp. UME65]QYM99023.1 hypothetical protein K1T36_18185 [Pseudomonas protegens]
MKKFSMPPEMKVASVWVVWAFLAIGALGWALFVVLDAFGVKDKAADWAQAVGSILAIFGAAAFPVFHSKKNTAEVQRRTDAIIRTAATLISKEVGLLLASMLGNIKPIDELQSEIQDCLANSPFFERSQPSERLCLEARETARRYCKNGHVAKWQGLDTLVTNIISSHMVTNQQLIYISHLMSAVSAAKAACEMLGDWELSRDESLPTVHRLDHCLHHVRLTIDALNRKI